MNKEKHLVIFTLKFPCGHSENFIEGEIKILAGMFHKVYFVPVEHDVQSREMPSNVTVLDIISKRKQQGLSLMEKLKALGFFLKILSCDRNKLKSIKKIRYLFSYFKKIYSDSLAFTAWLSHPDNKNKEFIFYSYWFDESATMLGILKMKSVIKSFVSRAHRFDLYEYVNSLGFIPFRNWQMKMVDGVYAVSSEGCKYLIEKNPEYVSKTKHCYLGVKDLSKLPTRDADQLYTIVSCSYMLPVKRVDLIAAAILELKFPVKWMHFGDGNTYNQVKEIINSNKRENVICELKGRITNDDLIKYYADNHIDLFINLSLSEGLPVSIMEAISFGIPVIATNVGGTGEIVNEATGVLVDVKTSSDEITSIISDVKSGKINLNREKIRSFYLQHFDAEKNYRYFANELMKYEGMIR